MILSGEGCNHAIAQMYSTVHELNCARRVPSVGIMLAGGRERETMPPTVIPCFPGRCHRAP